MDEHSSSETRANKGRATDPLSDALPPWEGSAILLVDLDAFFASVEQLDHPGWRGKPVIVGGDPDKRGVVSTASYEARPYGVRSAMPSSVAARLCPDAIWTHGRYDRYREMSKQVMGILYDESPHLQQVSIDEAFLDISPTRHNRAHPIIVARRIQSRVADLGVTCSIGLGTSKTIAKIASEMDKPQGLTAVYPGRELDFLAPLPIRSMSGIGPVAEKTLHAHGVITLKDLLDADQGLMNKVFGKNADMIRARSAGRDFTPVDTEEAVKSISNEMTFARDLIEEDEIRAGIATMSAKVGRRLRKKGLKGHTLSLRVRFDDRSVRSVQRRFDQAVDDDLLWLPMLYDMLGEIWMPGMPVRLVGVGISGFGVDAVIQDALFDDDFDDQGELSEPLIKDAGKRADLLKATDGLKDRFGEQAVQFGHEFSMRKKTTGSGSKNPEDYK